MITKLDLYHVCRLTHNATKKNDWHMILHTLREGLGMTKSMTYKLQPKDYEEHPELKELMDHLKEVTEGVKA